MLRKSQQVLSCKSATRSIKDLYQNKTKNDTKSIVEEAFRIYHQIDPDEPKNHYVINTMTKLCLSTKRPSSLWSIWNDIQSLLGSEHLSYPSLLRLCVESNNFKNGHFIHSQIPVHLIHSDHYIQSSLITFYGHFKRLYDSESIFDSIPHHQLNADTLSAMMKVYCNHKKDRESISLHNKFHKTVPLNDLCHLFALKSCINTNDRHSGELIIERISTNHHRIELSNNIIAFYGHFGENEKALHIFNDIHPQNRTTVTVNTMMQCHIKNGEYLNALRLYNNPHHDTLKDAVSHLLAIKCCTNTDRQTEGQLIIDSTLNSLHHHTNYMNTVIYFYSRFGLIAEAESVFQRILQDSNSNSDRKFDPKSVSKSMSAIMACYYEHGQYNAAVQLFDKYCDSAPDTGTIMVALKSYGELRDVQSAQDLFQSVCSRSPRPVPIEIVNSMLGVLVQNECFKAALNLYDEYESHHDDVSHILMLKALIASNDPLVGDLGKIRNLNHLKPQNGNRRSVELSNTLITFYGHFGDIQSARKVFDGVQLKTNVTINNMMRCLISNGKTKEALAIFDEYGCTADAVSVLLAIKGCTMDSDMERGLQIIESELCRQNLRHHVELQNTVIHFHGHFGDIDSAKARFEQMDGKSIQSINSMMTALTMNGMDADAVKLYQSLDDHLNPTTVTHLAAVKAYGKMGDIESARAAFNAITNQTIESINCMMTAFVNNGHHKAALTFYDEHHTKTYRNEVSHILALKAATTLKDNIKGQSIADRIGDVNSISIEAKCTLIDFYGNREEVDKSSEIFESIREHQRDAICINAMMTALFENNRYSECMALFQKYQESVLKTDVVAHVILLKCCCATTSYHLGLRMHDQLRHNETTRWILEDESIAINLIHLYGKCGAMERCKEIFYGFSCTPPLDVCNAMIHAFGRNGELEEALDLYQRMESEIGLEADDKIFTSLLNACSHSGDVSTARELWNDRIRDSGKYTVSTINALVDCFARNGSLEEAQQVIEQMDGELNLPYSVWMSLLSGCRKQTEKIIAEKVFKEMRRRFGDKSKLGAAAVLLSHIYGALGEFENVHWIRNEMRVNGWTKQKGISDIDINGTVYSFEAGNKYQRDFSRDVVEEIDNKLDEIAGKLKSHGFRHDFSFITKELSNEKEKEYELMRHSEKLAVALGLLRTERDYQIVINKNLRICNDCHAAFKLISLIEHRQLIVSDANRVHVFNGGSCSCNDRY